MSKNIIQLLERRQISCWKWSSKNLLTQSILKRSVILATIFNKKLLHGHVILGFSHRGDCVISYHCHIDFPDHKYCLHWWKFNIDEELFLISKFELFRDEILENSLYIVLYEDGINAYVFGCRNDVLESKPCYVSILPSQSPAQPCHAHSIHFKFELLLPYPSVFVADMHHSIPGCLVLNTGISLVCVRYNQTVAHQGPDIHNVVSAKFNTFNTQLFVIPVSPVHEVRMPVCNSSILMKVYYQNQPMVLLKKSNKLYNDGLVVTQITLDVDSWISRVVPFILNGKPYDYQCLCDYHLSLVEMDLKSNVVFALKAVVQLSSHVKSQCLKYAFTLIGKWHIKSGSVQLIHISNMVNSSNIYKSNKWVHMLRDLRKGDELCTLPSFTIRPLSNLAIFKGNSLQAISHPYLPLTLVL